jgi:peptidoglycan/LPS O-acetylase OafA/YrhL
MGVLRLLLALSVVFWHMKDHPFVLFHGGMAVEAFFVVSGFYMALVINEKYSRLPSAPSRSWVSAFYLSRVLRLAPAYLLVCLVEAIWYVWNGTPNVFAPNDLTPQARLALVFLNVFIVGQDVWVTLWQHTATGIPNSAVQSVADFFGKSAAEPMYIFIGQAWSLGVELMFYLIAPFVLLYRRRVLVVLAVTLLIRFYFLQHADVFPNAPWRSRFFPSNLPFFFFGVVGYWIYLKTAEFRHARKVGLAFAVAGGVFLLGSVIFAGGAFLFKGPKDYDQPRFWVFYLLLAVGIPFLFRLTKDSKWDGYVGELSYPIYLVHGLVLGIVYGMDMGLSAKIITSLAATVLLSMAIYLFIDRPMDYFRHRLTGGGAEGAKALRILAVSVVSVSLLLVLTGLSQPHVKSNPVPMLVKEINHYNIVKLGDKVYGVPQGTAVDWLGDDLERTPGLLVGHTVEEVGGRARNVKVRLPPLLVSVVGHYNIVSFDGRYYGAPQGVAVNFEKDDLTRIPGMVVGETEDAVRKAIPSH